MAIFKHRFDQTMKHVSVFTIKKINLICKSVYNIKSDTCVICRCNINEIVDENMKELLLSVGECGHVFHSCCITKWAVLNNKCPLCNERWKINKKI